MIGFLCRFAGRAIFASIFIGAALEHAKDIPTFAKLIHKDFPAYLIGDTVRTLKIYGMPNEWLSGDPLETAAKASIGLMIAGGVLVATRLLPRVGCIFLLSFLVPATYYQHFLPMQAAADDAGKTVEMIMVLKNVSLIGAAVLLFGYESSSGLLKFIGRAVFAAIFLMAAATHAQDIPGTAKTIHQEFPVHLIDQVIASAKLTGLPPTIEIAAMGAIGCMGLGGLFVATGLLPRLGSLLILIFLVPATFYQHVLPMQAATDHKTKMMEMIMVLKNVSMAGAALMIMGYEGGKRSSGAYDTPSGKKSKNKKKKNQ